MDSGAGSVAAVCGAMEPKKVSMALTVSSALSAFTGAVAIAPSGVSMPGTGDDAREPPSSPLIDCERTESARSPPRGNVKQTER